MYPTFQGMYALWRHLPCTLLRSWMPFLIWIKYFWLFSRFASILYQKAPWVQKKRERDRERAKVWNTSPWINLCLCMKTKPLVYRFFFKKSVSFLGGRHLVPPCSCGSPEGTSCSSLSLENYNQKNNVKYLTLQLFFHLRWKCTENT